MNCKRHLPSIKNPDLLIKVIGLLLLIDAINYPALMKKHETSRSEVTFSERCESENDLPNRGSESGIHGKREGKEGKAVEFLYSQPTDRPTHCPTSLSPFYSFSSFHPRSECRVRNAFGMGSQLLGSVM